MRLFPVGYSRRRLLIRFEDSSRFARDAITLLKQTGSSNDLHISFSILAYASSKLIKVSA